MDEVVGPSVIAIDRAQVSFDEVPLLVRVPGNIFVLKTQNDSFNRCSVVESPGQEDHDVFLAHFG